MRNKHIYFFTTRTAGLVSPFMSSGHEQPLVTTWLTGLYEHKVKGSFLDDWFEFSKFDAMRPHLGLYQFEAMCFAVMLVAGIILFTFLATRKVSMIPSRLQAALETVVSAFRGLVRMLMGEHNEKHVPFIGTLFIFIFMLNMLGLVPLFRSPTMVLSVTLGLGISTFLYVQASAIKANGVLGYFKHFAGPVIFLAPLMFVLEIVGECIKPFSLSLRLYGNISGEDTIIEQLLEMGGFIPVHLPMLFFAVFTSILQAFIFVTLTSIYITLLASHEH